MMAGMTTRSQEWTGEEATSKSAACRHWIVATCAKIAELRERDLKATAFFGLMLDGVSLGGGRDGRCDARAGGGWQPTRLGF